MIYDNQHSVTCMKYYLVTVVNLAQMAQKVSHMHLKLI